MADFIHGFEGVANGTQLTTANSAGGDSQFNTITPTPPTATWTFATTGAITGSGGGRVLTSTATAWRAYDSFTGVTQLAGRVGFTFNAAVPSGCIFAGMVEGTGFSVSARVNTTAGGNMTVQNAAGATLNTSAAALSVGTAYYLEIQVDVGTTTANGTINVQLYTVAAPGTLLVNYASGAAVNAGAGKTLVRGQLGNNDAIASLDLTFDNVLWRPGTLTPVGPPLAPAGGVVSYAPGWHPGRGLPGQPGGTPFYAPPQPGTLPAGVDADVAGTAAAVTAAAAAGVAAGSAGVTGAAAAVTVAGPAGVAAGTAGGYRGVVLGDSPSVYYRLGDSSAPAVPDAGAGGVNLAMTGTTVTFGQAGALAGDTDTAVKLADDSNYLATAATPGSAYDLGDGPFSIEFWYQLAVSSTQQTILVKAAGSGGWMVRRQTNGIWTLRTSQLADVFNTTALFTDTTSWHHVVMTRAAASQPHIYVDGVDQAGTYTASTFTNNTDALVVGRATATGSPFTGWLDELAIYKSVLTQAQVTAHYNAGIGGAANVTGAAAPVTVAGGAGTLASSANITGTAAPVTAAAPAGGAAAAGLASLAVSLTAPDVLPGLPGGQAFEAWPVWEGAALAVASAAAAVTGAAAPAAVAGGAGSAAAGANITGAAAAVTAAAPAGAFAGSANAAGTAAPVTAAGGAGVIASAAAAAGAAAPVTVAGGAGAASGTAGITGVAALVTVAGGAGAPAAAAGVTGAAAPVTVAGGIGAATAGGAVNVAGVAAPVTAASPAGALSSAANITGTAAPVTVAGGAGTVHGSAALAGAAAPVAVAAGAGSAASPAAVTGAAAHVTAAAPAGTFTAGVNVTGIAAPVLAAVAAGALATAARTAGLAALVTALGGTGGPLGALPFTIGTLTASTAPGGAGGTLTATDQRTGGPGG